MQPSTTTGSTPQADHVPPHPSQPLCLHRRTVLAGAGLLGLAGVSGLLTACGGGSGGAGASSAPVTVKKSAVPVGGGVIDEGSSVVVVQPTAGAFKAYSSICPHQGCSVSSIGGGIITCPCHGSSFRVADGSVVTGPATQGLTEITSSVRGDEIVVP